MGRPKKVQQDVEQQPSAATEAGEPEPEGEGEKPAVPEPVAAPEGTPDWPAESEAGKRIAFVHIPGFTSPAEGKFVVGGLCDFPLAPGEDRVDSATVEDIWIKDRFVHVMMRSVDREKNGERRHIYAPISKCTVVDSYPVPFRMPECCFFDGANVRHRKFMRAEDRAREVAAETKRKIDEAVAKVRATEPAPEAEPVAVGDAEGGGE